MVVRDDDGRYAVYTATECNCPDCDEYAHWQASSSVRTAEYLRTLGYDPAVAISENEAAKILGGKE